MNMFDEKLRSLTEYIEEVKNRENPKSYLIAVLHKAQGIYGYISKEVVNEVGLAMGLTPSHIWGVATFYHYFNLAPVGKYIISICLGTACYVKGAAQILQAIKEELAVELGQTTIDQLFTLQEARCLGACGLAPLIMINDKVYGRLTPNKVREILKSYKNKENIKNGVNTGGIV